MRFTAQQIGDLLNGEIAGDPTVWVDKLCKIEAGEPNSLSFLANPKYNQYLYDTKASIVIINKTFNPEQTVTATLIKVDDAYQAFAKLLELYNKIQNDKSGIEQPSYIDSSVTMGNSIYIGAFAYLGKNVKLGDNVKIYPHCYIGDNVTIGSNTTLFSGARIYAMCKIGANCILHSGVIIGADGFGFAPNASGGYDKVAQTGNVEIEDHVEIGSNTTIDRATLGSTIIRKGVKLDNLIQIAHNVEIGEDTVIAAQTGIAGSTKIGKQCMIGGQVGIVGHITIADKVKIQAQSGINQSITEEGAAIQGSPAFNVVDFKRSYVMFRKLPAMEKRLGDLEKTLSDEELKNILNKK